MATASQIQALLRFLTKDAKLALAVALSKTKELQKVNLTSPEDIAKSDIKVLQSIFKDEKASTQVLNAAKRISKKRANESGATANPDSKTNASPPAKRARSGAGTRLYADEASQTPYEVEASLALPSASATEEDLSQTVLLTNRAPLVLAFAATVLKYTMPEQPVSSRLSLAQAVVSANSRTKAVSLGIEEGKSAEEEGWGQGQPVARVLGREVRVLKRVGYDPTEGILSPSGQDKNQDLGPDPPSTASSHTEVGQSDSQTQSEGHDHGGQTAARAEEEEIDRMQRPALWGLDMEALRKANEHGRGHGHGHGHGSALLPIYTAQSARSYLLKSFTTQRTPDPAPENKKGKKKPSAAEIAAEKETSLGLLLQAIDLLCQSWVPTLGRVELDRRAWGWYVHVRPDVQNGVAGWGQKGQVKLSDILDLRRHA